MSEKDNPMPSPEDNKVFVYEGEQVHTITNVAQCFIREGFVVVICAPEMVDGVEYSASHAFPASKVDRVMEEFTTEYLRYHKTTIGENNGKDN